MYVKLKDCTEFSKSNVIVVMWATNSVTEYYHLLANNNKGNFKAKHFNKVYIFSFYMLSSV